MDKVRRLQYLEAMGIDVWLSVAGQLAGEATDNAAGLVDSQRGSVVCGAEAEDPTAHHGPDTFEIPVADVVLRTAADGVLCESPHPSSFDAAQDGPFPEGEGAKAAISAHAECSDVPPPSAVSDMDWEALRNTVEQCRNCGLCETRTHAVFGSGNKHAEWMLIGEAPGQQEDLQGEPFVGRAGQLLTEMLRAMGLTREEVYITNVLKCRPPNNRDPKPDEMAACNIYLQRQIELVRPKIILAVGRISAQHLLQTDAPLAKLRGQVHFLGEIPLIVIYHPAYLLRSLMEKRKAWDDLQMALRIFRESCR